MTRSLILKNYGSLILIVTVSLIFNTSAKNLTKEICRLAVQEALSMGLSFPQPEKLPIFCKSYGRVLCQTFKFRHLIWQQFILYLFLICKGFWQRKLKEIEIFTHKEQYSSQTKSFFKIISHQAIWKITNWL